MQRERESIDTQIEKLKDYAKRECLNHSIYKDDGFSASDLDRPAFNRLRQDIADGKIEGVVVTYLDRISRNTRDFLNLLEDWGENIYFKSLAQPFSTKENIGRLMIRTLISFAEFERDMISDRVSGGMKRLAGEGRFCGGVVPFGYALKKKSLFINENEAKLLKLINKKYLELKSIRGVTQWLNLHGHRTRNKKTWAATTIKRILSSPFYTGMTFYGKRLSTKTRDKIIKRPEKDWIIKPGLHPRIIDQKTWDTTQKLLREKGTKTPLVIERRNLLAGLVRCKLCGGAVVGYRMRRIRNGEKEEYFYYICHFKNSKGDCRGVKVNGSDLEALVLDKIAALFENKVNAVKIKNALEDYNIANLKKVSPLKEGLERLERVNAELKEKKKRLIIRLEDGTIAPKDYKERVAEIESEIEQNNNRTGRLGDDLGEIKAEQINIEALFIALANIKATWAKMTFEEQRELLGALVDKIILGENEVEIRLKVLPNLIDKNKPVSSYALRTAGARIHGSY
jgi:site-specific DNA recombinase